jgi:antitoxin component of MazEF toxin-antitoxin module
MYIRKLGKFGRSLRVALPPEVCKGLDLNRGDYLVMEVGQDGFLRVGKVDLARRPDLAVFINGGLPTIHVE